MQMVKEIIGVIAASLVFVAYYPYLLDIRAHKTRPHPYSWFIWGFNTALILGLQITHGAGSGAYTTATVTVMSFFIFSLGFRNGKKDIVPLDTVCLVLAIIAGAIWLFANQADFSALFLVAIDMLGFVPSLRKAWYKPDEETLSLWTINGFRHALSIFALQKYNIVTLINPLIWTVANFGFSLVLIGRRKISNR